MRTAVRVPARSRAPARARTRSQAVATVPLNHRSLGDKAGIQAPFARAAHRGEQLGGSLEHPRTRSGF